MSFDYKRLLKFEHNIGDKEKKYRLIGGSILILVSIFTASIFFLLFGIVLAATGYSGWCPAYSGFDKNTLESDTEE